MLVPGVNSRVHPCFSEPQNIIYTLLLLCYFLFYFLHLNFFLGTHPFSIHISKCLLNHYYTFVDIFCFSTNTILSSKSSPVCLLVLNFAVSERLLNTDNRRSVIRLLVGACISSLSGIFERSAAPDGNFPSSGEEHPNWAILTFFILYRTSKPHLQNKYELFALTGLDIKVINHLGEVSRLQIVFTKKFLTIFVQFSSIFG